MDLGYPEVPDDLAEVLATKEEQYNDIDYLHTFTLRNGVRLSLVLKRDTGKFIDEKPWEEIGDYDKTTEFIREQAKPPHSVRVLGCNEWGLAYQWEVFTGKGKPVGMIDREKKGAKGKYRATWFSADRGEPNAAFFNTKKECVEAIFLYYS